MIGAQLGMLGDDVIVSLLSQLRPRSVLGPAPSIAKPELRQHVQRRVIGTAIVRSDAHQHIIDTSACVLDEDIEVAIVVEHSGIEELILRCADTASAVLLNEIAVGILAL